MRLVMGLTALDEAEVVDAHLAFHLNAGVDFVIVADGGSPEAGEVLESYASEGYVRRVGGDDAGPAPIARLATEHGADWVILSVSNEFWWPRGESLKDVLVAIPPRYGIVQALVRDFLPRPGEHDFAQRMTVRRSLQPAGAVREPVEAALRPVHRADQDFDVGSGDGSLDERRVPLRAWYPIEVFRFPRGGRQATSIGEHDLQRGLEAGSLVVDRRLADALAALRNDEGQYARPPAGSARLELRAPDVFEDAAYAVEFAAVGEVDLAALDRHIRELEARIAWLEQRLWPRVLRTASRLVRRSSG
jgi:hypothetical protein